MGGLHFMATKIALFLHVAGVATWFGAMHILAIWLGRTAKAADGKSLSETLQAVHRLNMRTLVPSAIIVLAAGAFMLYSKYNPADLPLWLLFKERFGSLFILAYIIGFTLYGRKLKSATNSGDAELLRKTARRYTILAHVTTLLILIVILFATFQFT
nr:hypothetical protein [Bacillota bacterium]